MCTALMILLATPVAEAAYRSRLKICADAWAAAKGSGKVPVGQSWQDYYTACSARLREAEPDRPAAGADRMTRAVLPQPPAANQPLAETPPPVSGAVPGEQKQRETEPSRPAARTAASPTRSRQKQCAAQWRELKFAGQVPEGQTWPQFWSACNARLKAGE